MERPIVPALAPMSLAIENTLLRSIGFQEGGEFLAGTQDARTAGLGRSKDIGVFRVGIINIGWTMRKLVDCGSCPPVRQSDRKSDGEGKRLSVRVDFGGSRNINKKKKK